MLRVVDSKQFKPELEYMTALEMNVFKRMVESGDITFFRISQCEECGTDIIKGKKYCSKKCAAVEEVYEEDDDE